MVVKKIIKTLQYGSCSSVYEPQRSFSAVFYNRSGRIVYYYFREGKWSKDEKSFHFCSGDLSSVFENNKGHSALFYRGYDGYLHYQSVENGVWQHDNQSFKEFKVDGAISTIYETHRNHSGIFLFIHRSCCV